MPNAKQRRCEVLIVEDDQTTREALVRFLARLGYQAVAAGTVAEGLAQLDGQPCAILDLNLPDGAGTEILKRIRAEKHPTRVAVVTGTTDEVLWAETEKYQPELLLRKPFDVKVLVEWLKAG